MTRSIPPAPAAFAAFAVMAGGAARAPKALNRATNLAGSLGGELFAPPDQTGWAGARWPSPASASRR
ncbi:hypothetical protein HUX88_24620 [Duganella sp. BJB1802]|uniref:hypothetical protein n=1 Tax=Duganella sp. BJB1802 TaxID=2744575 RepID=UPI0015945D09|nr:hypothetical protein [Duganella sp. BJB1802]NVD73698.1 hypothetical protein [Duganella sp. BJB1802]